MVGKEQGTFRAVGSVGAITRLHSPVIRALHVGWLRAVTVTVPSVAAFFKYLSGTLVACYVTLAARANAFQSHAQSAPALPGGATRT